MGLPPYYCPRLTAIYPPINNTDRETQLSSHPIACNDKIMLAALFVFNGDTISACA